MKQTHWNIRPTQKYTRNLDIVGIKWHKKPVLCWDMKIYQNNNLWVHAPFFLASLPLSNRHLVRIFLTVPSWSHDSLLAFWLKDQGRTAEDWSKGSINSFVAHQSLIYSSASFCAWLPYLMAHSLQSIVSIYTSAFWPRCSEITL